LVFLERFREKNTDSLDKDIAAYLEAELIEGTSDPTNPATILRDRLKAICDKFKERQHSGDNLWLKPVVLCSVCFALAGGLQTEPRLTGRLRIKSKCISLVQLEVHKK
jgi:hypothetical protein